MSSYSQYLLFFSKIIIFPIILIQISHVGEYICRKQRQ
nr:MAG TPA: hypothetical protein [Bacteriophage sp.]